MMYVYDKSMAVAYASGSRNKRGRNCERLTLHEAGEQCSLLLAKRSERSGKAADGGDGSCRRSEKEESGARTDANE